MFYLVSLLSLASFNARDSSLLIDASEPSHVSDNGSSVDSDDNKPCLAAINILTANLL